MENIEVAKKCLDLLKSVDQMTQDLFDRNKLEYNKEFLEISKGNIR